MIKRDGTTIPSLWVAGTKNPSSGYNYSTLLGTSTASANNYITQFSQVYLNSQTTFDATNVTHIEATQNELHALASNGLYRWGYYNGGSTTFNSEYPTLVTKGDYNGTTNFGDNTSNPIINLFGCKSWCFCNAAN